MIQERSEFLQKTYSKLLSLRNKDAYSFFKCYNSLTRMYNYYHNDYNCSQDTQTHDFDIISLCFGLSDEKINHSVIADLLYVMELVYNQWNNTEKKKKQ